MADVFFSVHVIFLRYLHPRFCLLFFFLDFPAIYKLWNSPRFYDINVPAAWSTNIPRKNTLRPDVLLTIFENVLLLRTDIQILRVLFLSLSLSLFRRFFFSYQFLSLWSSPRFPTVSEQLWERDTHEQRIEKMRDSRILCRISLSIPKLGNMLLKKKTFFMKTK